MIARWVRDPDADWTWGGRHHRAWSLSVRLADGQPRPGPTVYRASQPSAAEASRTARRLVERGYWPVAEAEREAA